MNRLIIESVEGRIGLGITMFVAIMILVGWVAINEPARMAEFVEQHEGRSTERGAEIFAASCSTCHGINGYGIAGNAPALNSPHFFGYNYIGEVNTEIASFERDLVDITGVQGLSQYEIQDQAGTRSILEARLNDLTSEIAALGEDATDEERDALIIEFNDVDAQLNDDIEQVALRIEALEAGEPIGEDADPILDADQQAIRLDALQNNIPTRLAEIDVALNGEEGLYAQRDAQLAELADANVMLSGYYPKLEEWQTIVDGLETDGEEGNEYPLLLTNYLASDSDRLAQVDFGGAVEDYITTTLIHGRPGSNNIWPLPMVSWSQRGGGSLRDDQIGDLVSFITNWNKGDAWTLADFDVVNQYALIYSAYTGEPGEAVETVTDVDAFIADMPVGDAVRGELLYTNSEATGAGVVVGCTSCHAVGLGPDTVGTWTRVENQRLAQAEFADYTGEQYLAEAIIEPNTYIVAGFSSGIMPATYGQQLTAQDLSDIIAYLMTQNQ